MYRLQSPAAEEIGSNRLLAEPSAVRFVNSELRIDGERNLIVLEDGVTLENSTISVVGNDSLVYLSRSRHPYLLQLTVHDHTTVFIGKNNYFNGALHAITSEGQTVFIGDDGLFSFGIWIRTADPHLLYDGETGRRLNPSSSVMIGDHVWVGQSAFLLKRTQIGSGAVIGAAAVVSGKRVESNTVYAGNPARRLKSGVFFDKRCVHRWTPEQTAQAEIAEEEKRFLYAADASTRSFSALDAQLKAGTPDERLAVLHSQVIDAPAQNRFFIGEMKKKHTLFHK